MCTETRQPRLGWDWDMVCVILLMGWGEAMQLWGSSWAQEPIETPICCQTDWKCLCRSRWSSWRWSPASMCVGCTISSVAPKATTHAGLPRLIDTCQSTLWFGRAHFPQTRRLPVARFVTFSRVAFLHAFAKHCACVKCHCQRRQIYFAQSAFGD